MTDAQLTRQAYFATRHLPYWLREDAQQEAILGILQALTRFDPRSGTEETFVAKRALGAVRDWSRRCDPLTRRHREHVTAGNAPEVTFTTLDGAAELHMNSPEASPFERAQDAEVRAALAVLDSVEVEIITRLFWLGQTFRQAAQGMGYSVQWICAVRARAIDKLRTRFKSGPTI